jgi:2-oxoglutarate decarboxylase
VSNFADNFGANEWLVDEMYEKFKADPNSVDKTWWEFFKDYSPQTPAGKPLNTNSNGLGTLASAPKGGNPPAPKNSTASQSPFAKEVPVAPTQVSPTDGTKTSCNNSN